MKTLDYLKAALAAATPGEWVYEKERDTHDSCIHVNQSVGEYGYYGPMREDGGVVGSSEWIWIRDEDAHLITLMKNNLPALIECVETMPEVLRISDRKHDAWDRAKAALAKLENDDDTR